MKKFFTQNISWNPAQILKCGCAFLLILGISLGVRPASASSEPYDEAIFGSGANKKYAEGVKLGGKVKNSSPASATSAPSVPTTDTVNGAISFDGLGGDPYEIAQAANEGRISLASTNVATLEKGTTYQTLTGKLNGKDITLFKDGDTWKTAEEFSKTNPDAEEVIKQAEAAKNAPTPTQGEGKSLLDKAKDEMNKFFAEQTVSWNPAQYGLLIYEGIEGNEIDDATKKVKIKGAQGMGGSQGSPNASSGTQQSPDVPMTGSTVTDSVNALVTLLQMNPIDLSLLSTEIQQENQTVQSSASMGNSGSQAGLDVTQQGTSGELGNEDYSSQEQREIHNRRQLLLAEWAAAATQIGEGSNAISSAFYDRAGPFIAAASAANGSLGGISTINDTDRFVLFELTRGAALSAIQLGLQGAVTLSETDVTVTPAELITGGSVALPSGKTQ